MLIYEVNLEVDPAIDAEFRAWFPSHIERVSRCPGFLTATWFARSASDEQRDPGMVMYTVHYNLKDRASLDHYLANQAPALREEVVEKFGTKFRSWRRVLTPVE